MARFKSYGSKFEQNDGEKGSSGSGNTLVLDQRHNEVLYSNLILDDNADEFYCQEFIQGKD